MTHSLHTVYATRLPLLFLDVRQATKAFCLQVLSTRLELARLVSQELVQQQIVQKLLQQAEAALQVTLLAAEEAF